MDLEELLGGQELAALRGIVGEETPARHPSILSPCPLGPCGALISDSAEHLLQATKS